MTKSEWIKEIGVTDERDSVTGKGLCCDHFSWSSVFVIEFILNW